MASLLLREQIPITKKIDILDKISEKMNKKYGKVIMGRIGDVPEIMDRLTIKYIPTPSLELNEATGGGFPRRRCTIIAGAEDSGKTSLALETIALNMKKDPNFIAVWLESEASLEKKYIVNTFGIDPNRFFYMDVDNNLGAEGTLDILHDILRTGTADMCVINSLRCLVPEKEQESSLKDITIALQARMNARMTRKFLTLIAEYEIAFVIIQHLATDIGSMSRDPMVVAGGHAIKYWSSLTLDLRKRSVSDSDPIGKEDGVKIGVKILKNHCTPDKFAYVKFVYYAIFGEGIEQYLSTLDKARRQGIAECKGAWIYWYDSDGNVKEKWNGKMSYRNYMIENPEIFKSFTEAVSPEIKAMSGEEIEDIKQLEKTVEDKMLYDDSMPLKNKKKESKENTVA